MNNKIWVIVLVIIVAIMLISYFDYNTKFSNIQSKLIITRNELSAVENFAIQNCVNTTQLAGEKCLTDCQILNTAGKQGMDSNLLDVCKQNCFDNYGLPTENALNFCIKSFRDKLKETQGNFW